MLLKMEDRIDSVEEEDEALIVQPSESLHDILLATQCEGSLDCNMETTGLDH